MLERFTLERLDILEGFAGEMWERTSGLRRHDDSVASDAHLLSNGRASPTRITHHTKKPRNSDTLKSHLSNPTEVFHFGIRYHIGTVAGGVECRRNPIENRTTAVDVRALPSRLPSAQRTAREARSPECCLAHQRMESRAGQ